MQQYSDNVTDQFGNTVNRASVLVQYNGSAATIYSDNGVTVKANPITTGSDGVFDFYAANGTYTLTVTNPNGSSSQSSVTLFDPATLSASTGSSLVGHGTGTVADALSSQSAQVADYAALRAFTGSATALQVTGSAAYAGLFVRDDSDTTSADNNGTIIVASNGKRWKRAMTGRTYRPEWFGAIGDGTSHPLSGKYASLAAAQAVYPHAVALTDEIDWCAWRSAVQAVYDAAAADNTLLNQNFAHGKIECAGRYLFNHTLVVDVLRIDVVGSVDPATAETQRGGSASVTYNGPDGTADAPVYIFDCYTHTEGGLSLAYAPPGRKAQARGIQVGIHNMGFFGKAGSMSGAPSASGFVSAIRIRQGVYCHVSRCAFGGTLYDGVVFTGPQLFPIIEANKFYGVLRDCISNWRNTQDFSTTIWIRDNEFGLFGRYAILLDLYGSVQAMPIIRNNSIEGFYSSYYTANRAHYLHGAVCGVCVIGGGNMVFADNRIENGTGGSVAAMVADLHIVEGLVVDISDCTMRGILFTTNKNSQPQSAAFTSFLAANLVCDITDTRNYLIGTNADFRSECDGVRITNVYTLDYLYVADGRGLGTNMRHLFNGIAAQSLSFAVASDMIDVVTAKTPRVIANAVSTGSFLDSSTSLKNATTVAQPVQYQYIEFGSDNFKVRRNNQDNKAELLVLGEIALRSGNPGTKWNGYLGFQLNRLVGDMSAAEANYLDTPLFHASPVDENGANFHSGYYETGVIRRRKVRYEFSAAPVAGAWSQGDIVYSNAPAAGGFIGWVCVTGGTPGTWKTFGAITA